MGVLAPALQECCWSSWGDDEFWAAPYSFPNLPDDVPKWCRDAALGKGFSARFVPLWVALLRWSSDYDGTGYLLGRACCQLQDFMGIQIPAGSSPCKCHVSCSGLALIPILVSTFRELRKAVDSRPAGGETSKLIGTSLVFGDRALIIFCQRLYEKLGIAFGYRLSLRRPVFFFCLKMS